MFEIKFLFVITVIIFLENKIQTNHVNDGEISNDFNEWIVHKAKYNLKFDSNEEENEKFKAFKLNKELVEKHNRKNSNNISFQLRLNSRSHYSIKDFSEKFLLKKNLKEKLNGDLLRKKRSVLQKRKVIDNHSVEKKLKKIITEWNWVEKGYVNEVLDQKDCGSCYAFTSVGAAESSIAIRYKNKLVKLSEQQIIDCTNNSIYENLGCNGGLVPTSFEYMIEKGLEPSSMYPYINDLSTCKFDKNQSIYKIRDFGVVDMNDIAGMQNALVNNGPIVAYLAASSPLFQQYGSGVFDDPSCIEFGIDHAVMIVGFGKDKKTQKDYWLVKNTWGKDWGENGYIRIVRGSRNNCGIETISFYPIA